jgi:hypothetical protein
MRLNGQLMRRRFFQFVAYAQAGLPANRPPGQFCRMWNTALITLLAAALSACASFGPSGGVTQTASKTVEKTGEGLGDAVTSPLEDLNLKRESIPELVKDETSPYEVEGAATLSCTFLALKIAELDGILGDDFDAPPPAEDEKLPEAEKAERRAERASDATLGYISSEARGFIPFRGTVRYLSGASKHEKKLARTYAIASQRRAFLKGIGLARGCEPPAAPRPPVPAEDKVVFKGDNPFR